jgi:hypothetical protein
MAGGALLRGYDARVFFVCIHGKHFWRAEFHADVAAFAPGGVDKDLAARAFFCWQPRVLRLVWNNLDFSHGSPLAKEFENYGLIVSDLMAVVNYQMY